jgi:predicted flavoprotein YhiN
LSEGGKRTVASTLRQRLPERLASWLIELAALDATRKLSGLTRDERLRLLRVLEEFVLPARESEGYAKAEVTGGGIPLAELTAATLESRLVPGLYLCGEILDVTGRIGGYNFLWAWVTGRKAGQAAARHAAGGHGRQ